MSTAQPEALAAYQRQRSAQRRSAVIAAIAKLDRAAQPVTVAGVAALAGVDRSYIYSQTDLLEEIRRRRTADPIKLARRPAADRATKTPMSNGRSSRVIRVTKCEGREARLCNVLVADGRVVRPCAAMREGASTEWSRCSE